MPQLKITKNKYVLVDKEDFEWLNETKWHYSHGYALGWIDGIHVAMHRVILQYYNYDLKDKEVDHKNHNKLDNRKENIRVATHQLNAVNRYYGNTKGIRQTKWNNNNNWLARIKVNKKGIHLGCFKTKEEAMLAYNESAKKHFGEFAVLNKIGGQYPS